jgi:hypothetical protein
MSPSRTTHSPEHPERPNEGGPVRSDAATGPVDCVIVSPQPAGALTGHPHDTELLKAAVAALREMFDELRPRLVTGGVAWLHVAEPPRPPGADVTGLGWRMALAVQADGWLLRNAVTTAPTPGGGARTGAAAGDSTVFLLTRDRHYYFALPTRGAPAPDARTTVPTVPASTGPGSAIPTASAIAGGASTEWPGLVWSRERSPRRATTSHRTRSRITGTRQRTGTCPGRRACGAEMNPGDVWWLAPGPLIPEPCSPAPCRCALSDRRDRPSSDPRHADPPRGRQHQASPAHESLSRGVMPSMTAARAILLGCPPGGIVHDPLAVCGHGAVAHAARQLGRRFRPAAPTEAPDAGHDQARVEREQAAARADEAPIGPGGLLAERGAGEPRSRRNRLRRCEASELLPAGAVGRAVEAGGVCR